MKQKSFSSLFLAMAGAASAFLSVGCESTNASAKPVVASSTASSTGEGQRAEPRSTTRAHTKEWFVESNDSNGDGKVTKAEFEAARAQSHLEKDINGDGIVTDAEYVAEWEGRLEKRMAEQREASIKQAYVRYGFLDKDKNGNITLAEFNVSGLRTFAHYDTNGDGQIDDSEEEPKNRFGDLEAAGATASVSSE